MDSASRVVPLSDGSTDVWATDVWATIFFSDDHLGDTGWTFRRQELDVWATVVETFRRQKGNVTALTPIEQPQMRRSCKRLLSAISDVISSGCRKEGKKGNGKKRKRKKESY